MEQPQHIDNKRVTGTPNQPVLWIRSVCLRHGLKISDEQMGLLEKYVALLLVWNEKINLVSRKDVGNIWESHIAHCIAPLLRYDLGPRSKVLDLGTGGGLPGVVWKILSPGISMTLVDATQKKVHALQAMIRDLGLEDTSASWGRAEELGRSAPLKNQFDFVVARGVGPLDGLAKLSKPFLAYRKKKTDVTEQESTIIAPALLAFKGGEIQTEVAKAERLQGVRRVRVHSLTFDGWDHMTMAEKKFVIVEIEKSGISP